MRKIFDAHIHLDKYSETEISNIVSEVSGLITVSTDIDSCKRNLALAKRYPGVQAAFGYHPEQILPVEEELKAMISLIKSRKDELVAIGEVGLPYYLRKENNLKQTYDQYIEVIELFIRTAKETDKPIILHAVYEDASIVCDLLEKHSITKAHFHWFKGSPKIVSRLLANGYFISITPDVLYEKEISEIVEQYPPELLMTETDGPWPFVGPFSGKMTRPSMIHATIKVLSEIKNRKLDEVYEQIYRNTKEFYIV